MKLSPLQLLVCSHIGHEFTNITDTEELKPWVDTLSAFCIEEAGHAAIFPGAFYNALQHAINRLQKLQADIISIT